MVSTNFLILAVICDARVTERWLSSIGFTREALERGWVDAHSFAQTAAPTSLTYRGQAGGSARQLNTAAGVGQVVGNKTHKYWELKNGYLMPTSAPNHMPPHCQTVGVTL